MYLHTYMHTHKHICIHSYIGYQQGFKHLPRILTIEWHLRPRSFQTTEWECLLTIQPTQQSSYNLNIRPNNALSSHTNASRFPSGLPKQCDLYYCMFGACSWFVLRRMTSQKTIVIGKMYSLAKKHAKHTFEHVPVRFFVK